jgi:hypothetical protein
MTAPTCCRRLITVPESWCTDHRAIRYPCAVFEKHRRVRRLQVLSRYPWTGVEPSPEQGANNTTWKSARAISPVRCTSSVADYAEPHPADGLAGQQGAGALRVEALMGQPRAADLAPALTALVHASMPFMPSGVAVRYPCDALCPSCLTTGTQCCRSGNHIEHCTSHMRCTYAVARGGRFTLGR